MERGTNWSDLYDRYRKTREIGKCDRTGHPLSLRTLTFLPNSVRTFPHLSFTFVPQGRTTNKFMAIIICQSSAGIDDNNWKWQFSFHSTIYATQEELAARGGTFARVCAFGNRDIAYAVANGRTCRRGWICSLTRWFSFFFFHFFSFFFISRSKLRIQRVRIPLASRTLQSSLKCNYSNVQRCTPNIDKIFLKN